MLDYRLKRKKLATQWQLLLIYNGYRLLSCIIFLSFFLIKHYSRNHEAALYLITISVYFIFGAVFTYLGKIHSPRFEKQILIAGTIDMIVMPIFISFIGDKQSGLGVLLNVAVAALSILAPGRLAFYYASIASCMLLGLSLGRYVYADSQDLTVLFYSGIHGIGIYITAIIAWYLAHRVRISENIAMHHSSALAGMQRINEYIVERLNSGVIYVDMNKKIKLINSAARQFFNIKPDTVLHELKQVSPLLDEKYQHYLNLFEQSAHQAQTTITNPYLRIHFFPATVASETAVLITLDDMSAIAQHAQQLKLASLGRFSASIAHELRNPLGAISHAVQLMGDEDELKEEDTRLKQLIINNCNRMNGVIKNVLQLSRRQQSQPQIITLITFLEQFKSAYCVNNQCDIIIDLPANEEIPLVFDKSQLEQILVILCDNAIQHGRNESGEVQITIKATHKSYSTQITVCDTGAGVPDKLRNDIFEPFYSTVRTGNGLGLFIARDLCEINQARINIIESERGCCFAITLNQTNEILL